MSDRPLDPSLPTAATDAHELQAALHELALERRRTQDLSARVDEFARQVTADFEELAWLRECTNCIDLVDVRNDVPGVAKMVLPSLCEIISVKSLSLWHETTRGDHSSLAPACMVGRETLSDAACQRLISQFAAAAARGPVVRNVGVGNEPIFTELPAVRSFILIRVGKGGEQFGWLLAVNKYISEPNPRDSRSCNALSASEAELGTFEAAMVGTAAVLLGTHHRNLTLFREKEEMFLGVTRALINAIDAKDSYTCGHSDRVAQIARRLATELNLSAEECENIYLAGLLHDIGKIGVPDEVLLKPGKLTDEEFAEIKKHPEIGFNILAPVSQLAFTLGGVRHHHERYDGQGYPHGLAAEAIPLFGRIIAVADAYDAMTSNRLYRAGLPVERAEEILRLGAGQQWDRAAVAAFFRARNDIRRICGLAPVGDSVSRAKSTASGQSPPGSAPTSVSAPGDPIPPLEVLVPI